MANFMLPTSASPETDASVEAIFQQLIAGVSGLPPQSVRPRWTPTVKVEPEPAANWCAVGVISTQADASPAIVHNGGGDGSDTMFRHETIEVLASFYGPQGQQYAEAARDGLWLPQNFSFLQQFRMGFVDASAIRSAPELVNQQWRRRYDLAITVRRQVVRTYATLNLLSAEFELVIDEPAFTETVDVQDHP